jgi:hypothetical protein
MWIVTTTVPSLYFWTADRIAIGMGTWYLSDRFTTGIAVLGLPVEEMLFFASANLMTINGLVLFEWVLDWNDRRGTPAGSPAGVADSSPGAPPDDGDPDEIDPVDD